VKPETIRRLDLHLGKVLCFAFTRLRRLRLLGREAGGGLRKGGKILFIKFIEQGATVLAYDALREAVRTWGRENVYFAVFEENRGILDILGILPPRNVLSIRSGPPLAFLRDFLKTVRTVRRAGIDATVDLEFFTRAPAVFAFLTGAPVRVGLHRFTSELPYRGDLMTHRVQYNPYLHVSAQYALLVRALAADPRETPLLKEPVRLASGKPPAFVPGKREVEDVRRKIREASGANVSGPIVLLNPNASDMLPLRKWPSGRFVELGRRILRSHPGVLVLVTGAPSERGEAEELTREIGMERAACVAGRTTLRELFVLYTLADVLVTNDSGPSHFASLTNIDTVVLFGPETPALYGARRASTHVVWAALACSPCVNVFNHRFSPCNDNRCMQAITVDEVYERVKWCLAGRKKRDR
jgi:ADP-heptose:LPS heptosyltransferase